MWYDMWKESSNHQFPTNQISKGKYGKVLGVNTYVKTFRRVYCLVNYINTPACSDAANVQSRPTYRNRKWPDMSTLSNGPSTARGVPMWTYVLSGNKVRYLKGTVPAKI